MAARAGSPGQRGSPSGARRPASRRCSLRASSRGAMKRAPVAATASQLSSPAAALSATNAEGKRSAAVCSPYFLPASGETEVIVGAKGYSRRDVMFWSKTGGEFGQRRRSAGAAEGTELLQALFVQLSAAADAVLSSRFGWPTRYSHSISVRSADRRAWRWNRSRPRVAPAASESAGAGRSLSLAATQWTGAALPSQGKSARATAGERKPGWSRPSPAAGTSPFITYCTPTRFTLRSAHEPNAAPSQSSRQPSLEGARANHDLTGLVTRQDDNHRPVEPDTPDSDRNHAAQERDGYRVGTSAACSPITCTF